MKSLAKLQDEMQRAVLDGDAEAVSLLSPPPQGTPADRLRVYQAAYVLRLTEFLANDYEKLHAYLGDVRFGKLAEDYIKAHPSDNPNARWFSRHLPEFLEKSPTFRRSPEVAELAMLERALNDVFDGPETAIAAMADLAAISPEQFSAVVFSFVPTLVQLTVTTNVTSLWSCLKCGERPPAPEDLAAPVAVLVWRQANSSRFRILGAEEAMALTCARDGMSFAHVCEMIAAHDDPDGAAMRAAGYLRGWIEAEIISCIRLIEDDGK
jgi:hypothetical protein